MSGTVHFHGARGCELELELVGYQFPESSEWWDSNWLNVRVRVTTADGTWSRVDPCLTTCEVAELIDWLEASTRQHVDHLDFTEPNLQLDLMHRVDDSVGIRVGFDAELRPPWLEPNGVGDPFSVDFELHARAILAAAAQLRRCLGAYPERAARGG